MFTLINAPPSPYGRKVAVVLREKGIDHEVRYDFPWGPDTCTPEFSPLQQLPILIADDAMRVYDSSYILDWIEAKFPDPPMLPRGRDAWLEARLRQMLGERLMEFVHTTIFEHHRPDPSQPWIDRQTRKISGALDELDRQYATRVIDANSSIDLGDIAVATTLLLLKFVVAEKLSPDIPVFRWRINRPSLARAIDVLEQRPSFLATVPQPMDVDIAATVA